MIKSAFISYRHTDEVEQLVITLKKILTLKKFKVFDYKEQTYEVNAMRSKIVPNLNNCDLFIQILQNHDNPLGTQISKPHFTTFIDEAELSQETVSILEWEYNFFKKRNNSSYNQFCVFSKEETINTNNTEYLRKYLGNIWDDIPTSYGQIIDAVIKRIEEVRISNENSFVDGLLDTSLETTKIIEAIKQSINGRGTFPQKYLYSTLLGAELWKQLTIKPNSKIRKTYDDFPFQNSADRETKEFQETFLHNLKVLNKNINSQTSLNYVILGCGTGKREAEFVKWLDQHFSIRNSSVILVDIASELINMSINNFHMSGIHNLQYSIMDIEVDTSEKLRWIKEYYLSQEATNIFIFLGNTLANIDGISFLTNIKDAMDENDLLFTEFLSLAPDYIHINGTKTRQISEPILNPTIPYKGEKFDFITNVMKIIGEPIDNNNLLLSSSVQGDNINGFRIDQKFTYKTKANKYIDLLGISTYDDISAEKLFNEVFESGNYKYQIKEYKTNNDSSSEPVRMNYYLSKKN